MEKPSFMERLSTGLPVMLDGAMNTEMSRKGHYFNSEQWVRANLDAPELIGEIHADYARSGAEVHIANSFATGLHVLEDFGFANDFEALNTAAVDVCRTAIDAAAPHDQWIAGSISTFAKDHDRTQLPPADKLQVNVAKQAEILARAGCDLIALEMLFDAQSTIAMLNGAAQTGLPVSVGFVCRANTVGSVGLQRFSAEGELGSEGIDAVLARVLDAYTGSSDLIITVMHSEIADTSPAMEMIQRRWTGPLAVYPNNGVYVPPGDWDTSQGYSPKEFASACDRWIHEGAGTVGGCCGTGPEHIAELGRMLGRV